MDKQSKWEEGSITVEASISLIFFSLAMICLLFFINVGRAQLRLQIAANNAAREISQYMYIMKVTGLYSVKSGIAEAGAGGAATVAKGEENFSTALEGINAIANKIGSTDYSNPQDVLDAIDQVKGDAGAVKESLSGLKDTISGVADNPVGFLKSMGALLTTVALDKANNWIFGDIIGGALVKKNLGGSEADALLKSMNVDKGLDGLDLSHCVILQNANSANKSEDVNIVIIYEVQVFPLLTKNFTVKYAVSASSHAWLGGDNLDIKKLVK